jgi:uncharacterized protein YukE
LLIFLFFIFNPDLIPRKFVDENLILESQINSLKALHKSEAEMAEQKTTTDMNELLQHLQTLQQQFKTTTQDIFQVQLSQIDRKQNSLQKPLQSLNQKLRDINQRQNVLLENSKRMEEDLLVVEQERHKSVTLFTVVFFLLKSILFFILNFFLTIFGLSSFYPKESRSR